MTQKSPKVVVVTGASAGVGRATALAFARSGASVALLARGTEGLNGAVKEIEQAGGTALALPTDVANAQQVEDSAAQVEKVLGPIDVWVNNAMVTVFSKVVDMAPEEYQRVTEISYLGVVYGTQAALKRMRPRNAGTIIQVGSALAYRGIPLQSAYCGAKFAARGFTDSLRAELIYENSKIHLTTVHLAAFNTPQFEWARHRIGGQPQPLPPIFQPEVAAGAVVWSANHNRRELYVGFPALKIILGNKIVPGLIDYMASKQAIDGQMDKQVKTPSTRDNLFEPVPKDMGTHGRFDDQAKDRSWQLLLSQNRLPLALVTLMAGLAAMVIKRDHNQDSL
ncbi:SDR family oxidoreductase [Marinimicrobium sp. ABcell2]|uniref:SDR family oxidoreductase n=1 Tax=Marinimicrobium sp. ABcell2 TaxID=3069751 RepID=UPI0027B4B4E5|nr:SDR family oxidoreductase [Marinimicrobium sp. ABcell2]MDQ2075372.1 SDR family oxidoreductase [Marinimicrobium sp. ABcell2]